MSNEDVLAMAQTSSEQDVREELRSLEGAALVLGASSDTDPVLTTCSLKRFSN